MTEDEPFYCSFVSVDYIICECGETYSSEDELRSHLEKEHPRKKGRKEYKCGICQQIYPTEQECVTHLEHAHIDIKLEHNYVADPQMENQEQIIYNSNNIESDELTLKAEDVEFEDFCKLKEVIISNGNIRKTFKKGTKRGRKNVVCEVCGNNYASNAALRYHQRVHTGERPYVCPICPKTFTMPLFLKIHIRTHTGERPYKCRECPKAFSSKAALLRHDRVHTGVKPYSCPTCGQTFSQSNSMKLHVKTVHLKMPTPYKSKKRRMKEKIKLAAGVPEHMVLKNTAMPDILHIKPETIQDKSEDMDVILRDMEMTGDVHVKDEDGHTDLLIGSNMQVMSDVQVMGDMQVLGEENGEIVPKLMIIKQEDLVSQSNIYIDSDNVAYKFVYQVV